VTVRAGKIAAIALGSLIALAVIILIGVSLLVNPNDYKDRIARSVKDSTGRELALPGQIKLSVFPWIALELGPASLGNPPGFGAEPFAAVKHVALRVKLLPLFRKRLEIGRIEIDGLDLRLRKSASGKGNWEMPSSGSTPPAAASGSAAETLGDLAGITIKDTRLSFQDLVAERVNLEVGRVAGGIAVPVKVKLVLTSSPGAQPLELAGQFSATLDPDKKQYSLADLDLSGTLGANGKRVAWKFAAPQLQLDLAAQTLEAQRLAAQFAAARLSASLKGSKVLDAPSLSGAFRLESLSPRELMGQLGIAAPKTRDPKVLTRMAASGEFAYGDKQVGVRKLDVELDDSHLRGSAGISNLDTKATSFDLALDRIDLDRYRSPPEPAAKAAAPAPGKSQQGGSDPLKTLQMNGTFALGSASCAGLTLTELHVALAAKDGVVHIAPVKARLYGGEYAGDITLDDRGAVPEMKLEQTMNGVDVALLLKDLAHTKLISGHGMVATSLIGHGSGGDALLKSLNGHIAANLQNGAVEGIDLWFEINRALALLQKQALPSGSSSGRTAFDSFKATADLTNGVAVTKDLNIASQNLRVTGQGTANLPTEAIDYQVRATLLKQAPGATKSAGGALADIPLTITGTMASPKVRPDVEGMAKARVQQELDKHKDEIKQKLQDKLKDFIK
jgi:AsmA protein